MSLTFLPILKDKKSQLFSDKQITLYYSIDVRGNVWELQDLWYTTIFCFVCLCGGLSLILLLTICAVGGVYVGEAEHRSTEGSAGFVWRTNPERVTESRECQPKVGARILYPHPPLPPLLMFPI